MIDHNNLGEFADPVNYDLEQNHERGIPFYSALAEETGGPLLELACGTGRVTIPLARRGFDITGVDVTPGMIAQARRKSAALPINWVVADARTLRIDRQFRLIFMTGNPFQAFLGRADQEALLESINRHLHPGGLFAFETRNPRWADLNTDDVEEHWQTYTDKDGNEVRVSGTRWYDHVRQVLHYTTYRRWRAGGQDHETATRIALRYVFPQELEALFHYNGFTIVRSYGDWDLTPLTADSPSMICVCRRRE
jgi:SAM-dependent methyltransferase